MSCHTARRICRLSNSMPQVEVRLLDMSRTFDEWSERMIKQSRKLLVLFGVWLAMSFIVVAQDTTQPTETPTPTPAPQTVAQQTTPAAASQADDGRVALTETALARGANGETLLAATLRSTPAAGSREAPVADVRFIIENRGASAFSYLSGRVTFYDAAGVRCGEGLFTANSLLTGERAEVDAPGLRLTCAPVAWRITPVALVANGMVVGSQSANAAASVTSSATSAASPNAATESNLSIEINNMVLPVQLGNPIEVVVGGERVRIVVRGQRP